jgi:bacteriocin biosynthesis cyclodehydratase domain-containing protein
VISNPRLKPGVEAFLASTGDLYLIRTDGEDDLVLRDATPFALALVDALQPGGRSLATLGSEPEVQAALGELEHAGLLAAAPRHELLGAEAAARYDRQLHYFADQAGGTLVAEGMQQALAGATVVVLGAGGLGCWAMAGLACAGVGRIVAVDDDRVELANLNRQILYRTADIGELKVEVAGAALRALEPGLDFVAIPERVCGPDDVRPLARDAAFVVCTADAPIHRIDGWVNEVCLEAGVAHISAGQFPPRIRVGPTVVPGRAGCLACQELVMRREFRLYDELVAHRQARAPVAATLGAASGLIGSLIAMEVIHSITGICEPATAGRGLVFDLRDFSSHWEPISPQPDCPLACGERPSRPRIRWADGHRRAPG